MYIHVPQSANQVVAVGGMSQGNQGNQHTSGLGKSLRQRGRQTVRAAASDEEEGCDLCSCSSLHDVDEISHFCCPHWMFRGIPHKN